MSTPADSAEQPAVLDLAADALRRGDEVAVRSLVIAQHPGELADLIEALPQAERQIIWDLIPAEKQGDVLVEFSDPVRDAFVARMAPTELAATAEGLDPDDMADLVGDLPPQLAENVLQAMSTDERQRLEDILAHAQDTAGGLMTPDVLTVRADTTLEVVLRYLRKRGSLPESTDSLMVVDRDNNYLGQLWVSTLLTKPAKETVSAVMDSGAKPILVTESESDVARLFEQRDLISAPVVDDNGKLLGRITIDDVVDVLQERADSSFLGMAGVGPQEDLFAPVLRTARGRTFWLGLNLLTALFASWAIGLFDATIEKMVALAILMPIVASMGGNAASQTLAVTIRGLAMDQVSRRTTRMLLRRELRVGLLNGTLWAVVVALAAGFWFRDTHLGLIIGAAMVINLLCAAAAGFAIPVLLHRSGVDPALASTVFVTTVTDVVGFVAFLGLAALFLV